MDSLQNIFSPRKSATLATFTLFMMVYLSTPAVTMLDLSGNIDSISSGLLIIGMSFLLFLLGKTAGAILTSLLVVGAVAFNLGSNEYYDLQRFYLTKDTIYLISELRSLIESYEKVQILVTAVILLTALSFVVYITRKAYLKNIGVYVFVGTACIFSFVSLQFVYAAVTKEEIFYRISAVPIGHFARSTQIFPFVKFDKEIEIQHEREALLASLLDDHSLSLPDKFSASNIGSLLGESEDFSSRTIDPRYPLFRSGSLHSERPFNVQNGLAPKSNVLILLLESVRASEMGLYGAENSATPFLDSLGEKSIFVDKFYANSNFTVKSEHAIHCSAYDYMIGAPISKRDMPVLTQCLPKLLIDNGYQTAWFHGNTSEFYNRTNYLPRIGFQSNYSSDELTKEYNLPTLGWGITDTALLDTALKKLENFDKPFYAEILTVSNHMPFDFNWGIDFPAYLQNQDTMYDNYRRGIYYTDRAVKSFYDKFKNSKLADNTILVVTGDHGIWTFPNEPISALQKNESFFRVPLIIELPEKRNIKINEIHSHMDIAPTLFELLGLTAANDFIGQSIFSENVGKSNRMLYLMTEQGLSYRSGGKACIPDIQCQNNINCYKAFEDRPARNQCYQFDPTHDLLSKDVEVSPFKDFISPTERGLFDYSQMAIKLGTAPGLNKVEIPIAAARE